MFRSFFASAFFALSFASAFAQVAPTTDSESVSAAAPAASAVQSSDTSAASAPTETVAKQSVLAKMGGWLGTAARSVKDTAKVFTDGVKQGYAGADSSAQKTSTAATTSQVASQSESSQASSTPLFARLRALQSKLVEHAVGRQAPAPVENRDVAAKSNQDATVAVAATAAE